MTLNSSRRNLYQYFWLQHIIPKSVDKNLKSVSNSNYCAGFLNKIPLYCSSSCISYHSATKLSMPSVGINAFCKNGKSFSIDSYLLCHVQKLQFCAKEKIYFCDFWSLLLHAVYNLLWLIIKNLWKLVIINWKAR